jgi:SAM-dependent methyltransferase
MEKLQLMDSSRKVAFLEEVVRGQGHPDAPIEILEAGCGQRWLLKLDGKRFFLTGVDLDADALEMRTKIRKDLDHAIHGDLREIEFDAARFDVIYSAFVLEHIEGAEPVLSKMVKWLKPGGILVLEIPDPDSVKGIVTRISPHWFHVFYYRRILGIKTAGRPGHGPYRTYFDGVVSRSGVRRFCERNGLIVESEYGFATDGPRNKVKRALVAFATALVSSLSIGKFSGRHADLLYVLRQKHEASR